MANNDRGKGSPVTDDTQTTDERLEEATERGHTDRSFDENLLSELDRGAFAGEGATIEGEVVGTSEWTPGEPIALRVWTPLGDPDVFTEEMNVPAADDPLSASKFGRILAAHGYDRSQAGHLVGDDIEVSYDGDGVWYVVDPAPPDSRASDAAAADAANLNPGASATSSGSSSTLAERTRPVKTEAIKLATAFVAFGGCWWMLNNAVSLPPSRSGLVDVKQLVEIGSGLATLGMVLTFLGLSVCLVLFVMRSKKRNSW